MDVQESLRVARDPNRLAVLKKFNLLDTPAEEALDRLTRLACKITGSPISLVSLVDADRQFFKSLFGLPEPLASERETPLSHSFCKHVVADRKPLVIEDARQHPVLKDNLAIPDLGVIGYLGMPLTTVDGVGLGSFCVIDTEPRKWTDLEIEIVRELAQSVMAEIELRMQIEGRKKAQAKLAKKATELARSNEELEQYAYIISHDLQAPLRALHSYSRFLKEDYEDVLDEDGLEFIEGIVESATQLEELVAGLLAYGRIGREKLAMSEINVAELVDSTITQLQLREQADITLSAALPMVCGHPVRLRQIFSNLLVNAVKFHRDNVRPIIIIGCNELEDAWEFSIQDNGIGIQNHLLPKIFGVFQRLHTQEEYEGTGIGLAIVKKAVEEQGGQIGVTSQPGTGTKFTFTWPKLGKLGDFENDK